MTADEQLVALIADVKKRASSARAGADYADEPGSHVPDAQVQAVALASIAVSLSILVDLAIAVLEEGNR